MARKADFFKELTVDFDKLMYVLKAFCPLDGVRFGENAYRVAEGVYILSDNASFSFSFAGLTSYVNAEPGWRSYSPLSSELIWSILQKIIKAKLAKMPAGNSFGGLFTSDLVSRAIIADFFSIDCARTPRLGKSGFSKFLLEGKLTTIQWVSIYLDERTFSIEEVAHYSRLNIKSCEKWLDVLSHSDRTGHGKLDRPKATALRYRLEKKGFLDQPSEEEYLLKELVRGYVNYQNHKMKTRDYIIEIMKEHKAICGSEIREQLIRLGQTCTKQNVYHHLEVLEKQQKIELVKDAAKNGHLDSGEFI
jgi:hypothetical protein